MQKLKQRSKKSSLQLDPVTAAAIDKTVEAAISSKLVNLDHHIRQTIKSCLSKQEGTNGNGSSSHDEEPLRKQYNPEAGP